jgi:hypothetical protein
MQHNPFFCQNEYITCTMEKMWATPIIFKKLPKVNNRPTGENFPNPVTLATTLAPVNYLCMRNCRPNNSLAYFASKRQQGHFQYIIIYCNFLDMAEITTTFFSASNVSQPQLVLILNWFNSNPGVDIIITNFGDFSHFLSK